MAASTASEDDEKQAKDLQAKGLKPVNMPKSPYRPKMPSIYIEPDIIPDTMEDLDHLFKEHGNTVYKSKAELPPRDDVITFDELRHLEEFEKNVQWRKCPDEFRKIFAEIIKEHWDVFDEEGMSRHIRGFEFHIDTGSSKPVSCKPPRYGPHESHAINRLVEVLEQKGLIEDDFESPWGSMCVLAQKPNQEHLPWWQYIFRLCVSYRGLNSVTRPFTFPTPRCDDAVEAIFGRYRIQGDLNCGYWQIKLTDMAKPKTAFFVPEGKKRFLVMPMGCTNAHPAFVAIMMKFQREWRKKALAKGITPQMADSRMIVDDLIVFSHKADWCIQFFVCVLEVLAYYRASLKLRKCRFFEPITEFTGVDVSEFGNSPAHSKDETFSKLDRPRSWTDLRMIIGMFGFYANWLPLYEITIGPWRDKLKTAVKPGTVPIEQEAEEIDAVWDQTDDEILALLKEQVLSHPVLARPDPNKRYYLKTDWCKDGMAAVLMQRDDSPEAAEAERREAEGGPCEFELDKTHLRLHPIKFISRRTKLGEKSHHSYLGEAGTSTWAIEKFSFYLFGREFTLLGDMNQMKKFFETTDIPSHQAQRWRMQMLRYQFTIAHRSNRMVPEVNALSRYNNWTAKWRIDESSKQLEAETKALISVPPSQPIQQTNAPVEIVNQNVTEQTPLVTQLDLVRRVWIVNAAISPVVDAVRSTSYLQITKLIDDDWLDFNTDELSYEALEEVIEETKSAKEPCPVEWIVAVEEQVAPFGWDKLLKDLVFAAFKRLGLRAFVWFTPRVKEEIVLHRPPRIQQIRDFLSSTLNWGSIAFPISNTAQGGAIEAYHWVVVSAESEDVLAKFEKPTPFCMTPSCIADHLDNADGLVDDAVWPQDLMNFRPVANKTFPPHEANPVFQFDWTMNPDPDDPPVQIFDPDFPAPHIGFRLNEAMGTPFVIILHDGMFGPQVRGIRFREVESLFGFSRPVSEEPIEISPNQTKIWLRLQFQVPRHAAQAVIDQLMDAENKAKITENDESDSPSVMMAPDINQLIMLPLPTQQQWRDETAADHDLALVKAALENSTPLSRAALREKAYHDEWQANRLELEDGIIYRYEVTRRRSVMQLRTRVVPRTLRSTVIAACHASPTAGHTGLHKTVHRVITRFWWPALTMNIRDAVLGCGHCKLANITSHEAQMMLRTFDVDTPFDVVTIDAWVPGDIPTKEGMKKILSMLDIMTSYAATALISEATSLVFARTAFRAFFTPFGMPRMVIIDAGSENAGELERMCSLLGVHHHAVSPQNHKAILCERFHRYLNKVEKIHAADCETVDDWASGTSFATYAWNASPVDGTDVARSFAAIGREFPFPIDLTDEAIPRLRHNQGEATLQHIESSFPLLRKQRELLKIVNSERRRRHAELKNESRNMKIFSPGDLVIVKKQVQTREGVPAKLTMKARGPYRVLERIGDTGSYYIQRIPFMQNLGRRGKRIKESAARMEKLPSTMVIHHQVDGPDSRFATLEYPFVPNPLEKHLRIHKHGTYEKTGQEQPFAYDRVADMWHEEVDNNDDEDFIADLNDNDDDDMPPPPPLQPHQPPSPPAPTAATEQHPTSEASEEERVEAHDSIQVPRRRRRRKPERYRDIQRPDEAISTATALRRFWLRIADSKDKVFIIHRPDEQRKWQLCQVDLDETDPVMAREWGRYYVKWLMQHPEDKRKRRLLPCNSRYWPRINQIKTDGSEGNIQQVRPAKVEEFLKKNEHLFQWTGEDINLAELALVGPINFAAEHKLPNEAWDRLREKSAELNIDTNDAFER